MKKMIILRGVPGSGKSTFVNLLTCLGDSTARSADKFFSRYGTYEFDSKLLGEAHAWCQENVKLDCESGISLVIVDNTNTCRWEFQPYLDIARENGYEVTVIEVQGGLDGLFENVHGVNAKSIDKMLGRFQHAWWEFLSSR